MCVSQLRLRQCGWSGRLSVPPKRVPVFKKTNGLVVPLRQRALPARHSSEKKCSASACPRAAVRSPLAIGSRKSSLNVDSRMFFANPHLASLWVLPPCSTSAELYDEKTQSCVFFSPSLSLSQLGFLLWATLSMERLITNQIDLGESCSRYERFPRGRGNASVFFSLSFSVQQMHCNEFLDRLHKFICGSYIGILIFAHFHFLPDATAFANS